MTKSDWLQCPSLYVTNMVLVTENIYEHRSKSTYAGLHVSSPYEFVVQSVFFQKKDSCLNSAGFCCCFCLFFVCCQWALILLQPAPEEVKILLSSQSQIDIFQAEEKRRI